MPDPNLLAPNLPHVLLSLVLFAVFWLGVPVTVFLFARRLLRAVERRGIHEAQLAALSEQLQRLEARLDDVAGETDRLREGQRFTERLLTDRGADGR